MSFSQFEEFTKLGNYYPYNITLNLTNACNLKCRYCFVHQKPDFMTLDIAKKGIDFIYLNMQKHKYQIKDVSTDLKCVITLFGGEPLLTFHDVIKPLYEYIDNKYGYKKNFTSQITTNGLLINQEVIDFIQKYNINILFSFDGIKEIQDINRPCHDTSKSSFDVIMDNFIKYVFPNNNLHYELRATADLDHVDLWYKNFLFFNSLPIPAFSHVIEFYTIMSQQQIVKVYEQLNKICEYIFNVCVYDNLGDYPKWVNYDHCLGQIIQHNYEELLRIRKVHINDIPRYITNFCGYALEYVAMDAYGNFYPCREDPAEYQCECHPTLIGNVNDGIDYMKLYKLKQEVNKLEYDFFMNRQCQQDCWYADNNVKCEYAECPSHAFREKNISTSFCVINSYMCKRISHDMNILINQYQNKTYINYLKKMFPEYRILDNYYNASPAVQQIMLKELREQKLLDD